MAGLDRPTTGRSFIGDLDIGTLDDAKLTQLRRDRMGFVFQSFNLVPTLTAAENITLPADLAGTKVDKEWFDYLVSKARPRRPAIAPPRRTIGGPAAACGLRQGLDQQTRSRLRRRADGQPRLELRQPRCWPFSVGRSRSSRQSIVMVTHDPHGAAYADRVVFLADGKVVDQLDAPDRLLGPSAHAGSGAEGRLT